MKIMTKQKVEIKIEDKKVETKELPQILKDYTSEGCKNCGDKKKKL